MSKEKKFIMSHRGFLQVLVEGDFSQVGTFSVGKDIEGRSKQIINLDLTKLDLISKGNGNLSGFINEYDPEKEKKAREFKKELYSK